MKESNQSNRAKLIAQLRQVSFCATPTVMTYDLGLQYDCICSDGAGTGLGNILTWPAYKIRSIANEKWSSIRDRINSDTLCLEDLFGTDLYEFAKNILLPTEKVDEDGLSEAFGDLLSFPEGFSSEFYCLFDDIDWDYERPEFYETKEAVLSAFEEKYSIYDEWDSMDEEELEEWLTRSKDDLAEFPFMVLDGE